MASSIGELADLVVQLPGVTKDQSEGTIQTVQPKGFLFEQTLLIFYDAIILRYMEKKGLDSDKMYGKHANLESSTKNRNLYQMRFLFFIISTHGKWLL